MDRFLQKNGNKQSSNVGVKPNQAETTSKSNFRGNQQENQGGQIKQSAGRDQLNVKNLDYDPFDNEQIYSNSGIGLKKQPGNINEVKSNSAIPASNNYRKAFNPNSLMNNDNYESENTNPRAQTRANLTTAKPQNSNLTLTPCGLVNKFPIPLKIQGSRNYTNKELNDAKKAVKNLLEKKEKAQSSSKTDSQIQPLVQMPNKLPPKYDKAEKLQEQLLRDNDPIKENYVAYKKQTGTQGNTNYNNPVAILPSKTTTNQPSLTQQRGGSTEMYSEPAKMKASDLKMKPKENENKYNRLENFVDDDSRPAFAKKTT